MRRSIGLFAVVALAGAQGLRFDVASVKPCKTAGSWRGGNSVTPGRLDTGCAALVELIRSAYISWANGYLTRDPGSAPLSGGPAWIESEQYTISAKAEGNPGAGAMNGAMMRALLEERFQLKIRRESREVPVYALTVDKAGAKLKAFQKSECVPVEWGSARPPAAPAGQRNCQMMFRQEPGAIAVEAEGISLSALAKMLTFGLDRPVVDRTAIGGLFDIRFEFGVDQDTPRFQDADSADANADPGGSSVFVAVRRQLGLRLDPAKGAREFLAIDRVERPSEN